MTINDEKDGPTSTTAIVGYLLKAAGEDPNLKQSGRNLGRAALTISEAVNHVLLPLAAANYGIEKAKRYFLDNFNREIERKIAAIPPGDLVAPKSSIAGPALQALAYTYDELDLKELYLNLLASAMNKTTANKVHPAFVEILKQLSPDEAVLLFELKKRTGKEGEVENSLFAHSLKSGYILTTEAHVDDLWAGFCEQAGVEVAMADSYQRNLIRLGILVERTSTESSFHPGGHTRYGEYSPDVEVIVTESLNLTGFGARLFESCFAAEV